MLSSRASIRRVPWGGTALLALVAVAALLRAPLLGGGQIDYDEGVYWQSLRAMAAGSPLFTAVYSSQPPAFLLLLLPGHLALGGTIVAERLTVLALTLAGVAAAGRLSWLLGGSAWAGWVAAALLAADPLYFRQSVTLQADGPAVALALVGVAFAAEGRGRPPRVGLWLTAVAGAVLAVAVLTKLLALAALPAALVLLLARRDRVPALAAAVLGGAAAAAVVLLPFAGAWPELWRQAVGLHLGARSLPAGGLDGVTVVRGLPIAALGVLGGAFAVRRAPLLAAAGGAWAAAAALLLAVQHPLWPHHAVVLVPALALLGGGLPRPRPAPVAAAALAALIAGAVVSFALTRALQQPPGPGVAALRASTAPGDLVLTDDQYAAALAGRDVPPQLVDTSLVRVASGDLTAAQLEGVADRDGVRAVLLSTGRLARLPGLRAWAAARYPEAVELGGGRTLYRRG